MSPAGLWPNPDSMGQARKIAIKGYMKRHGVKLCWVAACLGMDEALLRYHIAQGMNDPQMVRNFKALMRARAQALIDDLEEIQEK